MADFRERERVDVDFKGEQVHFNRIWRGHRFSDEEVAKLAAGDVISFMATSKAGKPYEAWGYLAEQVFVDEQGREVSYFGFKLDFDKAPDRIPHSVCGHVLSDAERRLLESGQKLHVTDLVSKRTGNTFEADLQWGDDEQRPGHKRINLFFD